MSRTVSLVVALSTIAGATAGSASQLGNVDDRSVVSLDGKWRAIADPYDNGFYDYRHQPRPDGFFRNARPVDKTDHVEYDFETSGTLDVPGDWNTQRESLFLYEGTVWYKRSFDWALRPRTRLFVHFGAVNYHARVWLNGELLGEHVGGFTPFAFEITDKVRASGNFLVVMANDTRERDAVPALNTDWWNYGGITRRVLLVEVPETFVEDYFVQLRKGSRDEIAGWVQLNGPALQQKVTVRIPALRVAQSVATNANGFAPLAFKAPVELWSPERPKLYDVEIASQSETLHERIGFRTIETRGSEILLNGQPVFLRGVCVHEEAPIRGGRAFTVEDARTLLGWAKELGANFVRLAHYPHSEFMTREAERLGLLVWSEVPVYWTILWDDPSTFENAKRQLAENIGRDKNRASIIMWSMANETPVTEPRTAFIEKLVAEARRLDPTRLITAALERHYFDENTQMIDDPLGSQLDVLGWYDGPPEKCDRLSFKTIYDKPLVVSEFGGGALAGHHGDALTRWTEEYQASLYEHQLAMLARIPFLRGTTPWILMDFRSPRRQLPGIQDFWNRKGLIGSRGEKKKAFYVLQRFYTRRPK
jgi:beta-glucuronidase